MFFLRLIGQDGTFDRKETTLFLDKSSAKWFNLVSIYTRETIHPKVASTDTTHRSKCIIPRCRLDLDFRSATTAWLSQWHTTWWPLYDYPHAWDANTIGSSSFSAMYSALAHSSHWTVHTLPWWERQVHDEPKFPPPFRDHAKSVNLQFRELSWWCEWTSILPKLLSFSKYSATTSGCFSAESIGGVAGAEIVGWHQGD